MTEIKDSIRLKQFIEEKQYRELAKLEEICSLQDKTNLKLELDYKLNLKKYPENSSEDINEYLYYHGEDLVAYLGISSFGGSNIAEINGMVHPDFRRKGLYEKLFKLAIDECQKRSFYKILLIADGKSYSGTKFIEHVNGKYDFSEYRMKVHNKTTYEGIKSIKLRKAKKQDAREIARQNAIYFGHSEEYEYNFEIQEVLNEYTYLIELSGTIIGKIRISFDDNSSFISGFGLLPDYRGKGYGKLALKKALQLIFEKNIHEIELDVECKNDTALHLYKSCGFEEMSVMNYYKYNTQT